MTTLNAHVRAAVPPAAGGRALSADRPRHPASALALARATHKGQQDADGSPYLAHIAAVVNAVAHYADTEVTRLALLHDALALHPQPQYVYRVVRLTQGPRLLEQLQRLTWRPGVDEARDYAQYISSLERDGWRSMMVKMADLCDQLQTCSRPDGQDRRAIVDYVWYLRRRYRDLQHTTPGGPLDDNSLLRYLLHESRCSSRSIASSPDRARSPDLASELGALTQQGRTPRPAPTPDREDATA